MYEKWSLFLLTKPSSIIADVTKIDHKNTEILNMCQSQKCIFDILNISLYSPKMNSKYPKLVSLAPYNLAGSSRPSFFWSLKKRRPGMKRTHRAGQNGPTKSLYDFSKAMNKCDKSWGWSWFLKDFTKPSQFDGSPRPRARLGVPSQIVWLTMACCMPFEPHPWALSDSARIFLSYFSPHDMIS